jgi:hypothetical protein
VQHLKQIIYFSAQHAGTLVHRQEYLKEQGKTTYVKPSHTYFATARHKKNVFLLVYAKTSYKQSYAYVHCAKIIVFVARLFMNLVTFKNLHIWVLH